MSAFRPFEAQLAHYLKRPHEGPPDGPVPMAADWRAADFADEGAQRLDLSAAQVAALGDAVDRAMAAGRPMTEVSAENLPVPELAGLAADLRARLEDGTGFAVLRGLPVADWGEAKSAYAFWTLGHQIGLPGGQNPQGDLLGHVHDLGEMRDNPLVRRYRTAGNIYFHCDAADVVGLLCLRTAKTGGQSRIASSVAIFNALMAEDPALARRLFEPVPLDRRGEEQPGQPAHIPVQPCAHAQGRLRTFYHSEYFRSAARHFDPPGLPSDLQAVLDRYDALASDPRFRLDMWLQPGDMQFLSNHLIVHARTAYEDWPEPERRRHLLRLWLSLPEAEGTS